MFIYDYKKTDKNNAGSTYMYIYKQPKTSLTFYLFYSPVACANDLFEFTLEDNAGSNHLSLAGDQQQSMIQ